MDTTNAICSFGESLPELAIDVIASAMVANADDKPAAALVHATAMGSRVLTQALRRSVRAVKVPVGTHTIKSMEDTGARIGHVLSEVFPNTTRLIVQRYNLLSAEPLTALSKLEALDISNNEVLDIAPLTNLTRLTHLKMTDCNFMDMGPLAALTNLFELDISRNVFIPGIEPLAALTRLTSLGISSMKAVRSVAPLKNLTQLKVLDAACIGHYTNGVADLMETVASLTQLTELDVCGIECGIEDITPLAAVTTLKALDLSDITDFIGFETLGFLTNLTRLDISDIAEDIEIDIGALEKLTSLKRLDMACMRIEAFDPLSALTQLTCLNIAQGDVTDVSPLSALTALERLYISGCTNLTDITPLATLTRLKALDVSRMEMTFRKKTGVMGALHVVVKEMTNLHDLAADEGRIDDNIVRELVSAMKERHTHLTRLSLAANEFVDASPLKTLTSLKWLDLSQNRVVDVSPLTALTQMEVLNLWNMEPPVTDIGGIDPKVARGWAGW